MAHYKALFLLGGFGTRLATDINRDRKYYHLKNLPKGLLPLNGKPLLDYWVSLIPSDIPLLLQSNQLFYANFLNWSDSIKDRLLQIHSNGVQNNETRLGSVGDMALAVKTFHVDSDLLVIAGDTLFLADFDYTRFIEIAQSTPGVLVASFDIGDEGVSKVGILEVERNTGRVTGFKEKPNPDETTSRLACPCFYYIPKDCLPLINVFLEEKKGCLLEEYDASGKFLAWLISRYPVFATGLSGRLDIGGLSSYIEADDYCRRNMT